MLCHNGVGLMVQGGVVIGSWDVIIQGVVARLELVLEAWRSKKRGELNIREIKVYQKWGCQEAHMGWPMAHTWL